METAAKTKHKISPHKVLFTVLLYLLGITMLTPLLWMISTSFKIENEVFEFPIRWIPKTFVGLENYKVVWGEEYNFGLYYLNSIKITILSVVFMYMLVRSRHGRAIMAIREDDIASEAVGIPNTYYKVAAFSIAAFFAGVAGGIYAHYLRILGAKTFNFTRSIEIIVIVVLGGMGSITGSIVAAIVLTVLPEALRSFSDYRMLAYSVALIIVMIFKPSGLFGRYEFSLANIIAKIFGKKTGSKKEAVEGGVK